jgi:hypothetical protein
MNPQTGEEVDESGCAIAWTPILLLENARHIRSVAAATEDFRNKVVEKQLMFNNILPAGAKLIE